ncbi:hypothetical protein E3P99_01980 [Wallemia hederae]|uniref:H/ACA ribonucleoprotein complex non-core subunit NAF1 n=1 Tax=Wallemia hederae TaxID=1540922 RepID=A0A4T0FQ02_9BASI|nr:hypothetical protein E3P99_01980 [Wallemia hederae]
MESNLPQDIREILENSIADQPPDPEPVLRRQRSSSVSSSSSSSSSEDDSEDSDKGDDDGAQDQWEVDSNPIIDEKPLNLNELELEDADDPVGNNAEAAHTKNELIQHTIRPLPFAKFPEDVKLILIGHLHSLIDQTLVIQSTVSGKDKTLDQGTLLCLEDGTLLGEIFETFGAVDSPLHSVLVEASTIDKSLVKDKKQVFYAPQHATIIDTRSLAHVKGSDASNLYDEEIPEWQQEHSDDEAEQSAKREKKASKKKSKGGPGQGQQQQQPQRASRRSDDFVDYVPRQRPVTLDYNSGDFNPEAALAQSQMPMQMPMQMQQQQQQQQMQQQMQAQPMDQQYNPYQFMQMPFNPMAMAQQYAAMQAQLAAMQNWHNNNNNNNPQ